MPLLKGRVIAPVKPLEDIAPDEKIFTIAHTKEQFRSRDEYDRRDTLYRDAIWTCRCTGHVNLSYAEAGESERASLAQLTQHFPRYCEKRVLTLVHHSTVVLDTLVDQTWMDLQQTLMPTETVNLNVKSNGKIIQGTIVKMDSDPCVVAAMTSPVTSPDGHSPSSDKENNAKVTPDAAAAAADDASPKKWTPPKLLPYKYSLKLMGQDKVIYGVPAQDLTRVRRPPSKELLRLFIRAHSLRPGSHSSPWHVDQPLVRQYAIPSKFADLFVSPAKMKEYGQKAMDAAMKKKKKRDASSSSASAQAPAAKRRRRSRGAVRTKGAGGASSSEDDVTLAQLRQRDDDDDDGDDEDDVALADLNRRDGRKRRKSLKQMTLFDMRKGKMNLGGHMTPKKSSSSSRPSSPQKSPTKSPYKQPPLVVRLVKAQKDHNKRQFQQLLSMSARDLSGVQRNKLPTAVKTDVMRKWREVQEKRKMAQMGPEERSDFMEKKREEVRMEMKKERALLNRRYEDTELDLQPLPTPAPVPTPDAVPNELFGDVVMVTEFLSCYAGLLLPHSKFSVLSDVLMNALAGSQKGSVYLSQILLILLQTLLQDPVTEHYRELSLPLSDLTINWYTTSELVRLCLQRRSDVGSEEGSEDGEGEEEQVPEETLERLETAEFSLLEFAEKLRVLVVLCRHLVDSYAVQDFMTQRQQRAAELWKRKIADMKEKKDQRERDKERKCGPAEKVGKVEEKTEGGALTLEHFYGRAVRGLPPGVGPGGEAGDEPGDGDAAGQSRAGNRQLAKQQTVEAQRQRSRQKAERLVVLQKQHNEEIFEQEFQDGIYLAKTALRQVYIGTDRNHCRYWLFHQHSPGLHVEKGWAGEELSYRPVHDPASCDTDSTSDLEINDNEPIYKRCREKTTPPLGQNLWFRYDSEEQLDALLAALHPRGARESRLADALGKIRPTICDSMAALAKRAEADELSDDDLDIVQAFKQELEDLALRLSSGGLGRVVNFELWRERLYGASTVAECGVCLTECQAQIPMKFRKGLLAKTAKKVKTAVPEDARTEDAADTEEAKTEEAGCEEVGVAAWTEAVIAASSFSRLHLLLAILDSSVKWDKSAEAAKCKICRKKSEDDEIVLLCDGCNQAFHMYCLRPALTCVPDGDWFCVSCQPVTIRKNSRGKNYRKLAGEESDSDSEQEEDESERTCHVCGDADLDDLLVICSSCMTAFHQQCHQPPLQRAPRSSWRCSQCTTGVYIRKKTGCKADTHHRTRRQASRKVEETEDEDEESDEEEYERPRRPRSRRRATKTVDDDGEEEEGEEEDGDEEREEGDDDGEDVDVDGEEVEEEVEEGGEEREESSVSDDGEPSPPPARERGAGDGVAGRRGGRKTVLKDDKRFLPTIIHRLQRHRLAWPFIDPVDTDMVPDYQDIVACPMDLETVRTRCAHHEYPSVDAFVSDVHLVFSNATLYNQATSVVGQCIQPVRQFFTDLMMRYLPRHAEDSSADSDAT